MKINHSRSILQCCQVSFEGEMQQTVFLLCAAQPGDTTRRKTNKQIKNAKRERDEERDGNLYTKAEKGEDERCQRRSRTNRYDISAVTSCLCTLFAEFGEEAEARDGRPGEDDGVLAGDVLAELFGHKAVELRLVLQGGQTVCTFLQMDGDLQCGGKETGHKREYRTSKLDFSFKYHFIVLYRLENPAATTVYKS